MKEIKREYSNAKTPQQKEVAKRKNRTLIEAARTMLVDSLLPITFWAEAVNTAFYVLNRALVTKTHNKAPYELLNGRTPRLDFMRPFGCLVIILNTLDPLGKFKGKADERFLVGYSVTRNQTDKNAGPQDTTGNADTQDNVDAGKEVSNQQYIVLPLWSFISSTFKISGDKAEDDKTRDDTGLKTVKEPVNKEDQAYRDELDRLISPEKEASDATDALRKEYVQGCTVQRGATTAGSTNPVNCHAYDDDLDIFTSSVQSVGAEADFNNMESSTIVSPILTHRVHLDHLKDQILRDPKSTVQTRGMAKKSSRAHAFVSYIHKQRRTNHKDYENCLFACFLSQMKPKKVSQALDDESWVEAMQEELLNKKYKKGIAVRNKARLVAQGHRQEEGIDYDEVFTPVARIEAIRIFLAFASFMGFIVYQTEVKSAFLCGIIEDEVYVCQPLGFLDPHFPNKVYKVEKLFMVYTKLPEPGLQVKQSDEGIFISQDKPDIMFVVCAYSRFQVTPKLSHLHVVKWIFRRLTSWQCKKQTIVATSTIKAEYVAATNCFNLVKQIHAIVDGKDVVISESSVRSDILFNDEDALEGEGSAIPPEPQLTPSTSQPNISEPQTAPLQTKTHLIVSHEPQTEAHIEQILPSSSTYQRKHRKTYKHRRAKKVTKLPQTSVPLDLEVDEAVYKEAAPRNHIGGVDAQTRFEIAFKKSDDPPLLEVNTSESREDRMEHPDVLTNFVPPTPHDLPLLGGHTPGSDEGRPNLLEVMNTCTQLSNRILALEEAQTTQDKVITRLKLRVRRLEKKRKARTSQPMKRRLFKGRVKTHIDKNLDKGSGEKGGSTADQVSTARPEVCTASVPVNVSAATPSTPPTTTTTIFGDEDLTIAQTLIKLRSDKAKVKGVAFRDVEEPPRLTRLTTMLQPLPTINLKDKEHKRKKQKQEEATITALTEEFDEIQARIDADHELVVRMTHEEQEKYTIKEKERLLAEYFERRKKQLAAKRAEAIRNKPPTRTQVRNRMITYLKHMEKMYPLIKKMLEKMLNWKLEAEAESKMAFELLIFIKS
uniref:Integrase catalytic domain-containing protein n=1 Tax=Tanacetum cinerariifolium TaxID=118510 RepID=A0A699HPJ4_TANCI|nr:hypothetical protein [Tanacetum cinerariifolium]